MGLRLPKTLSDLVRWDANLRITCGACGRTVVYDTKAIVSYFYSRRWNTAWEAAPSRFRCDGIDGAGCGAKAARLAMEPKPMPHVSAVPEPLARDLKAEIARRR